MRAEGCARCRWWRMGCCSWGPSGAAQVSPRCMSVWICLRSSQHSLPIQLLGDGSSSRCPSTTARPKGTAKVWDSRCRVSLDGRITLTAPCAAGGAGNLFNPGKTQSYSTVGLHLKSSDALHALAGRVGAFGDFDSDQYTDVFWIHDEALEVCVCVGGCEDRRRAVVQGADDARIAHT